MAAIAPFKMRSILIVSVLAFSGLAASQACTPDRCLDAVTSAINRSKGTQRITTALQDCNVYLLQTTTAPGSTATLTSFTTTTITVTETGAASPPAKRSLVDGSFIKKRQGPEKSIPDYVKPACANGDAYSTACVCFGARESTTTIPGTSDIETSTIVTETSTVTTTVTPPTSTYSPAVPTDYSECYVNPETARFELLDPASGVPFVNKNGLAGLATSETDEIGVYEYVPVEGAPNGVYDIAVTTGQGRFFLAVFNSEEVGYVAESSLGQQYIERDGRKYITTVWSIECSGKMTLGILGRLEWTMVVSETGFLYAGVLPAQLQKRAIPVIYRIIIIVVRIVFTPISPPPRCPNPELQLPYVRKGARAPSSNGCGPAIIAGWIPPNLNFKSACDKHDLCFDDCKKGFDECNDAFLSDNYNICTAAYPDNAFLLWGCNKLAEVYTAAVRGPLGGLAFKSANSDRCDCCEKPKSICPEDSHEVCVDLLVDNKHCGACGNECKEGSICENGACSDTTCTGQRCDTFGPCGPGGSCVCASTIEGTGFCVDGNTPCANLPYCESSSDCPVAGQICAVGTCCGINVCIGASFCGGFNPTLLFDVLPAVSKAERTKGTVARVA